MYQGSKHDTCEMQSGPAIEPKQTVPAMVEAPLERLCWWESHMLHIYIAPSRVLMAVIVPFPVGKGSTEPPPLNLYGGVEYARHAMPAASPEEKEEDNDDHGITLTDR